MTSRRLVLASLLTSIPLALPALAGATLVPRTVFVEKFGYPL